MRAMRPAQWSKHLFVLTALVFSYGDKSAERRVDLDDLRHTLSAFGAFCLVSGAIYLLNDVMDAERDRAHPEKRRRPIASGELSIRAALVGAALAALLGLLLCISSGARSLAVTGVVGAYAALNVAYSLGLKHVVLLDVFCIATGFLLRVKAGGLAAGADVSHWLMLCTLFLALFLALNKRRAEIQLLGEERGSHRRTLREYDVGLLDQLVTVLAACTIVCYTMYTVDEETMVKFGSDNHMVWSVPFVVFGIARYMFLVQTRRGGQDPTRILLGGDALFLLNLLAWTLLVGVVVVRGF